MAFTATTPTGQSFSSPTEWYDQYLADLTALGGTLAKEEYTPYGGPRIAEWTPDQQAAFGRIRDSLDMWKPFADQANDALLAGQGGLDAMRNLIDQSSTFDRPTFENTYLDIYMDPARQMQDAADSIGNRNFQNTTLKSLNDAFAGTGQFGSGRNQILGADAAAMAQAQIEEAKAGIGMQATHYAMGDYHKWAQQGLNSAQQLGNFAGLQGNMATNLMNFGSQQQQAALNDAYQLGNIGTQQQALNQQNLNLAYQDFQDQQAHPWQQLDRWSSVVRGQSIPNYGAISQAQPVAPTTSTNPWLAAAQGGAGGWQMGSVFK